MVLAFYSLHIDRGDPFTHISPAHIRGARIVAETSRDREASRAADVDDGRARLAKYCAALCTWNTFYVRETVRFFR